MTPEIAAEAIRAYVEESNRLNRQRQATESSDKAELAKVQKAITGLVEMAEQGRGTRALVDRLLALETKEDTLRARLAAMPDDMPDIHPNIAEIYRRKIGQLAEALDHPEERNEAADAIRGLIERVTLLPGAKRGEVTATLQGEFGAILEWIAERERIENDNAPSAIASGVKGVRYDAIRHSSLPRMSVSVVAGTGFEPVTFRL